MASSFPTRLRGVPPTAVPHRLALVGSSSRALPISFRVSRAEPARRLPTPSTFLGVSFPIATSTGGVHSRGHPKPTKFRPRRFSRPRRFPPPPALRVYFTPLPRPGFALQGFSLLHSRTGSSPAVALLPFPSLPYRRFPDGARAQRPPSGLCSVHQSVTSRGGLAHVPPAPLLSFPFLGFFFACREDAFDRRLLRPRPFTALGVSPTHNHDEPLRARHPRPRFPTCAPRIRRPVSCEVR